MFLAVLGELAVWPCQFYCVYINRSVNVPVPPDQRLAVLLYT